MEQSREEAQQQQKQPHIPLRCPRCGSLDTRFRYFNNNRLTQPRRHCRTCKRQWTVGGKLRLIPFGGNTKNGKPAKASSSRGAGSKSQPAQPTLSLGEGHQQHVTLVTATSEPYQTHTEVTNAPPSHSYNNGLQPVWPMNVHPQDIAYDFNLTMSNDSLQHNLIGDTTDSEDTTYVNVDEWLNLEGCDPS